MIVYITTLISLNQCANVPVKDVDPDVGLSDGLLYMKLLGFFVFTWN